MAEAFLVHRFTVGRTRYLALELPEPAKNHAEDSPLIQHWKSNFSNVVSQVRSGLRKDSDLLPRIARDFAEIVARKTDSPFFDRIEFGRTRSGKVLLRLALEPKEKDYSHVEVAAALSDHPATMGAPVNPRYHGRGRRP